MSKLQKFIKFVSSEGEDLSLEHRLFHTAIILGVIISFLGFVVNFIFFTSILAVIIPLLMAVMLTVIYHIMKFNKIVEPFIFPINIFSIVVVSTLWVLNGGINGSNLMPGFIVLILGLITVSNEKKKYIIAVFVLLFSIVYLIQFYRPDLIVNYASERARWFDSIFTFIYCSCIIYFIVRFFHNNYTLERAKLAESEAKYRLLAENASDVIWVLNLAKMKFTYISPAIFQLAGFTVEEAMTLEFEDILTPESTELANNAIREHANDFIQNPVLNNQYSSELQHICKNGEYVWIEIAGKYWYNSVGEIEIIGVSRNIDKRKRMENEIRRSEAELRDLNATKDKFFSIIAHDLRNPFNGFMGLTQIMAENMSKLKRAEIQKLSVTMRNSATNLFRLLKNLLEWAKMQQGLIPFNPKQMKLQPIVNECIATMIESAKSKEIELTFQVPADMTVFADYYMLYTVIRNLVSNAIKFTPKSGSVTLLANDTGDRQVEILVRDTGIGMNQEMIDYLFQLDVKTNRKGTEGELGTGLGLLLCKEFVEKNGGKLWAESEEEKGSTFYFTMQIKP